MEITRKEASQDQKWLLHVDGSSTAQGSGAGIVITTPQDTQRKKCQGRLPVKTCKYLEDYRTRHITIHYLPEARAPPAVQPITTGKTGELPIIKWIEEGLLLKIDGKLPGSSTRATHFIIQEHILYKKSYTHLCSDDAIRLVSKCERCQKHSSLIHQPAEPLTTILSPYPFRQWGIDIVGPFPLAAGQRKFLLVAVDYFTKWVEVEPLARITEGEPKIQEWCQALRIRQRFTTVAHLRPMGKLRSQIASWTTPRGSTGETPFSLVYGTEAIIPAELGMPSHKVMNFYEECNENLLRENLDLIEELREKAFLRIQRYKNIMIQFLQQRVKSRSFQVGDLVLRRVDALKPIGKLDPTWEGPYKVTSVIGKGAYELEDPEGRPLPRPWNVHNLKKYFA
ncbi:UNVERIFIED_CONTAM: hypothetical protein Slati_4546100 [Sesamum latifolium]|uniref:Integrase catalytic domain-containing protein n=1 Tax=Sesamum latifolium TaxID=2727402 RepID=A0AAW2S292_9LAMI